MDLSADDAVALISFAFEREEDEKIFERWVPIAQNFMTFDAFKESLRQKTGIINEKAVISDVMDIIGSMEQNHGNI